MNLDLENAFGFEIILNPILKMMGRKKQYNPIATFQKFNEI
jgi:hypothetical protein